MEFIFDTNVFNRILDDSNPPSFSGITIYASHVQRKELEATKNNTRREALLNIFKKTTLKELATETMVFPLIFSSQKFGDGTFESIRDELNFEIKGLKEKKRRNKEKSHPNDALIAEIAIKNSYTLVTDDNELFSVVSRLNSKVIRYDSFVKYITKN